MKGYLLDTNMLIALFWPSHAQHQQPYIYITLRNVTRNTVLWSTFNFANQPGVPWKTTSNSIQYTDWQAVDVAPGDAHLSVGDTQDVRRNSESRLAVGALSQQSSATGETVINVLCPSDAPSHRA